jgi:hypothetical protein
MASRLIGIYVKNSKTTSKYVDKFHCEIYSDVGLTTKVGQKSVGVTWNGTHSVQKDLIVFDGLTLGTTYYLRGGFSAPITGTITWASTHTQVAGDLTAPACTYTTATEQTTSGVEFAITPANIPTDFEHWEAWFTKNNAATPPVKESLPRYSWLGNGYPNRLLWSQDFSNAAYTKNQCTVSADSQNDPNGAATADRVTPDGGATDAYVQQDVTSTVLGTLTGRTFTFSVYLKAASGTPSISIRVLNQSGTSRGTQACALTTSWQRFSVAAAMQSGDTTVRIQIGGGTTWVVAEGAVDMWGAQLEEATSVSASYHVTGDGKIRFFVAGDVGDTLRAWIRGVDVYGNVQDWVSLGSVVVESVTRERRDESTVNGDIFDNRLFNTACIGTASATVDGSTDGQPTAITGYAKIIGDKTGGESHSATFTGEGEINLPITDNGTNVSGVIFKTQWNFIGGAGEDVVITVQCKVPSGTANGNFRIVLQGMDSGGTFNGDQRELLVAGSSFGSSYVTVAFKTTLPSNSTNLDRWGIVFYSKGNTGAAFRIRRPGIFRGPDVARYSPETGVYPITQFINTGTGGGGGGEGGDPGDGGFGGCPGGICE